MGAHRLLNSEGVLIGMITLDRKETEDELVRGLPELRLAYSTTPTDIVAFTLEVIPPSTRPTPDILWDDQKGQVDGQRTV